MTTDEKREAFMDAKKGEIHKDLCDYFDWIHREENMPITDDVMKKAFAVTYFEELADGSIRFMGTTIYPGALVPTKQEVMCSWPLAAAIAQVSGDISREEAMAAVRNVVRFRHTMDKIGGPGVMMDIFSQANDGDSLSRLVNEKLEEIAAVGGRFGD